MGHASAQLTMEIVNTVPDAAEAATSDVPTEEAAPVSVPAENIFVTNIDGATNMDIPGDGSGSTGAEEQEPAVAEEHLFITNLEAVSESATQDEAALLAGSPIPNESGMSVGDVIADVSSQSVETNNEAAPAEESAGVPIQEQEYDAGETIQVAEDNAAGNTEQSIPTQGQQEEGGAVATTQETSAGGAAENTEQNIQNNIQIVSGGGSGAVVDISLSENAEQIGIGSSEQAEQEIVLDEADQDAEIVQEESVVVQSLEPIVQQENKMPAQDGIFSSFNEKDCYAVRPGELYCSKKSQENAAGSMTGERNTPTAYAAKDMDGDQEIFFETASGVMQLTHNTDEDTNPFVDPFRKYVVWQELSQDQWNIFLYDIAARNIRKISMQGGANINPSVWGDLVVWQGWENDNWEIYLLDVRANDPPKKISTSALHDMFPRIATGLVTWQTLEGGSSWQVYAYDIDSGATTQITEGAGKHEHPRFVMVWDDEDGSGTRAQKGRDLGTGEIFDLASGIVEQRVPVTIPGGREQEENQSALPAGVPTAAVSSNGSVSPSKDGTDGEQPSIH